MATIDVITGGSPRGSWEYDLCALCLCRSEILWLCVPKPRPCRSSGRSILADDATETVPPTYREAFDLVGLKRLWASSQRRRGTK